MTAKQFYDWQTSGGTDDVMRLVDCLERADIAWCAIGGVAVNHSAREPMVTQDVDFVVATDAIERTVSLVGRGRLPSRAIRVVRQLPGPLEGQPATQHGGFLSGVSRPSGSGRRSWHSLASSLTGRHSAGKNQGMGRTGAEAKQTDQGSGRYRPAGRGTS